MNFSLFTQGANKRDRILAIDLGSRATKAVLLQRKSDTFSLLRYAVLDAPIYEKNLVPALLTEHLRNVIQVMDYKGSGVSLAIGSADSLLRNTEMPLLPVEEMRQMLRFNTKNYLQQDLPDHLFDCWIMPQSKTVKADPSKGAGKYKVWVGAARRQLLTDIQAGVKAAGLVPDAVTLGVLGPLNAFEVAQNEVFSKEVIALVDLGFKSSSISLLAQGELCLSRVVDIGGDKLTTGLSEVMGISYAEAEGIKVGMPAEVEVQLQPLLSPLGRELRASIDFFEHQQDRPVQQVFISGGAARSEFFIQNLQSELMIPCKSWNPATTLQTPLPENQLAELEYKASQLVVAIGVAISGFNSKS